MGSIHVARGQLNSIAMARKCESNIFSNSWNISNQRERTKQELREDYFVPKESKETQRNQMNLKKNQQKISSTREFNQSVTLRAAVTR